MSRRRGACLAVLVCATWGAWVAAAPAQQSPFRAQTDLVSVPVSVMKGREPVTNLTTEDFLITDNGVPQTLTSVTSDRVPMDVTLVLTARSCDRNVEQARGLVNAEATRHLLHPSDVLRTVWVSAQVAGGVAGGDERLLADPAARAVIGNGTAIARGCSFSLGDESGTGIALADGLFYALARPVAADRRHLVVVFTDGWDTASTLDMDTLEKLAVHSDAVLHAVVLAAPGEDTLNAGGLNIGGGPGAAAIGRWQESYDTLGDVVRQSGGTLLRTGKVVDALDEIIADFRSSYVLRYVPRGVAPSGWHRIDVRIRRPGSFRIRARNGYEGTR